MSQTTSGAQVVLDFNSDASRGARGVAAADLRGNTNVRDANLISFGLDPVRTNGPPTLVSSGVAVRAPTATDDASLGYRDAGQVSFIVPLAIGTGWTTASVAIGAPPGGGVQATANAIIGADASAGKVIGYRITNPGKGYLARPSVTTTGDGSGLNGQSALSSGDLWVRTSPTKQVWQLTDATVGAAVWTPLTVNPFPADAGPAAMGLYGTAILKSGYAGNCLDITRASDNTTAVIGFVGGLVDAAAADAFVSGTVGRITRLYDQSGNAAHFTATAANAPFWSTNTLNGFRCVTFASIDNARQVWSAVPAVGGTGYVAGDVGKVVSIVGGVGGAATATITAVSGGAVTAVSITPNVWGAYGTFPTSPAVTSGGGTTGSGLTLTLTDSSCQMTATMAAPYTSGSASMIGAVLPKYSFQNNSLGNFGGTAWRFALSNSALGNTAGMVFPTAGLALPVSATPDVVVFSGLATGGRVLNGNRVAQINAAAGTSVSAVTLGSDGVNGAGVVQAMYDTCAVMLYATPPTEAQIVAMRASLSSLLNITPQAQTRDVWHLDGASIDAGYNPTSMLMNYERVAQRLLARPLRLINRSLYGNSMQGNINNFSAIFSPLYDPLARVYIVSVMSTSNDIAGGTTGAAAWALTTTEITQLLALGSNVRVLVTTVLPRQWAAGPETERIAYNNLVRANYQAVGAVGVMDFAASPVMGNPAAINDGTLYSQQYSDKAHPTDLGHSYLAPIAAAAINAVLAASGNMP